MRPIVPAESGGAPMDVFSSMVHWLVTTLAVFGGLAVALGTLLWLLHVTQFPSAGP